MKRVAASLLLVALLTSAHLWLLTRLERAYAVVRSEEVSEQLVPSALLKLTALEHSGVVADYLFLESLSYIGQTFERKETPRVKAWEWRWLLGMFKAATDLDPYFMDPYYLAHNNLTWEAGMTREVNELLDQAIAYRDWDPWPPFMAGFNAFYFLKDNERAARYMMESYRRPNSQPLAATLAVRLAANAKRNEIALLYLEDALKAEYDPYTLAELKRRKEVISTLLQIEQAADEYLRRRGEKAQHIDQLVAAGLLAQRPPKDPYGGVYLIDAAGEVKSTSNMFQVREPK